jgi:hypothetical protein
LKKPSIGLAIITNETAVSTEGRKTASTKDTSSGIIITSEILATT